MSAKRLLIILALSGMLKANAQISISTTTGAQATGMGLAGICGTGLLGLLGNPAALATLDRPGATMQAGNRFLVSELREVGGALAFPAGAGAWGIGLASMGFSGFRDQQISGIYARHLFPWLQLGARIHGSHIRIPGYGGRGLLNGSAGIRAQVTKALSAGAIWLNPFRQTIAPSEKTASAFGFGLGYQPSSKTTLLFDAVKTSGYPIRIHTGLEYWLADPLWLRFGLSTQPIQQCFGIGIRLLPSLRLDLANAYHPYLGFSPIIGLNYNAPSKP